MTRVSGMLVGAMAGVLTGKCMIDGEWFNASILIIATAHQVWVWLDP